MTRVAILATSREALGVRGQRAYPLASLSLPVAADPDGVLTSESGLLFVLRAEDAAW